MITREEYLNALETIDLYHRQDPEAIKHTLLEDVKKTYKNLGLDDFSDSILKKILTEDGVRKLEQKLMKNFESQLKKAGITSSIIQGNMLKGNNERIKEFKEAAEKLRNHYKKQ